MKLRQWRCHKAFWLQIASITLLFVGVHQYFSHKQYFLSDSEVNLGEGGRRLFGKDESDSKVLSELAASDHRVVNMVKTGIRQSLSKNYNLSRPNQRDFSRGQSIIIDTYLKGKTNGVFIEAGAFDGERYSVSIFFEQSRGWEGLLIEPNPNNYDALINKNRKCSSLNACVRTNDTGDSKQFGNSTVPCYWMESILPAFGKVHIDLLSVDIKGQELSVLKTIPFDKYRIEVITVEFADGSTSQASVANLLTQKGYKAHHQFVNIPFKKSDLVFIHI